MTWALSLAREPDTLLFILLAGVLLVYVECNRPGSILPGCLGTLLILLALHRLSQFPLDRLAIPLSVLGAALVPLEALRPLRKLLLFGGIALLTAGLRMLVQPSFQPRVHLITALAVSAVFAMTTDWLAGIALRARRNKRSIPHLAAAQDRLKQSRCTR